MSFPLLRLRWMACLWAMTLSVMAADLEQISTADGAMWLSGIGLNRQLNEDFYIAAIYLPRPARTMAALFDDKPPRRLELRVVADRIFASGVNRHFRDLILINNSSDAVEHSAADVQRFCTLFKSGLVQGDTVVIEAHPGRSTTVRINGQNSAEFSLAFFDVLLRSWVGERNSEKFRAGLLAQASKTERDALLERFAALVPADERRNTYAGRDSKPEPATAAVTPPAPVISTPANVAPPKTSTTNARVGEAKSPTTSLTPATTSTQKTPAPRNSDSNNPGTAAPVVAAQISPPPVSTPSEHEATAMSQDAAATSSSVLSKEQQDRLIADYGEELSQRLNAVLTYPLREMQRKYGATQLARRKASVMLRLHLERDGSVNAAWLQKGSGETVLDSAALNIVENISDLPAMSAQLPDKSYEFFITMNFDPYR